MISISDVNSNVLTAEYAVRGAIVTRAGVLQAQLNAWREQLHAGETTPCPLPYEKLIFCNIGNPHALEFRPLTYIQQTLSLLANKSLLELDDDLLARAGYSRSCVTRTRVLARKFPTTLYAYTEAAGHALVRGAVADFISRRDGMPAPDPACIFTSDGATPAISRVMNLLRSDDRSVFLVPVPGYSLYTAVLSLINAKVAPYYLDEEHDWTLSVDEIARATKAARAQGLEIKGLVIINPNNPCGSMLPTSTVEEIIDFCGKENIPILADEVYQDNVNYLSDDVKWESFRKVLARRTCATTATLFSFHSISKGFQGLCGLRGGYVECMNVPADVRAQMNKLWAASSLSSNATGQIALAAALSPPVKGEDDYATYIAERDEILASLQRRAVRASVVLNSLPRMTCRGPNGAMYAFPCIDIPAKAVQAAKERGVSPDYLYCEGLLEEKGVVVVPGSGFLQKEGTYHFRTTLLPAEKDFDDYLNKLSDYHVNWMQKWE